MARYFADTSCLIGMTFLHDSWYRDAIELLNKGNSVYLSEFVLYEYCNEGKKDPLFVPNPDDLNVEKSAQLGVFDKKVSGLNDPLFDFEDTVEMASIEGNLSFEWVVDTFFEYFDFRDDDYRVVHDYFSTRLDPSRLSFRSVQHATRDLVDLVHQQAIDNKDVILAEASVLPSRYDDMSDEKQMIKSYVYPHKLEPGDMAIILDAVRYCQEGRVSRFVTGDKKHMMPLQEALADLFGLSVLYVLDEFEEPQIRF